jgi:superfamily I DNA and/or RNA helicase
MQQLLQSYQRRLSNISGNNRSLLLLRLIASQTIDIHDFNFLDGNNSFEVINQIIKGAKKIKLSQVIDSRDTDANKLTTKLKGLQRKAQFILEETGAFDLYIGWPFVHGQFADGTNVRAPLMFFPVKLSQENNDWVLETRDDVNISLNKSVLLAYSHYNKVDLAEDLIERSFDDFDEDSRVFRTNLYELLRDSAVEVNFNQELFTDELIRFKNYKKSDFDSLQKTGELKLFSEAVLGIFPQADSYLMPDYDFLMERGQFNSLEEFFNAKSIENDDEPGKHSDDYSYFLNKVKEEQTYTPFLMDAYQENAIKAVKRGNSIVVQGPPGTGKSQMISNLVADYIARGKSVLVVCQKRAALDVIYSRLSEKKLNDFIALVHDFKNDRKDIYEKIASQIERLNEYQSRNNNLDTIQIEREFQISSRVIDEQTEVLEEYKKALFDETECGISVKELYLTSDPEEQSVSLTQEYNQLPLSDIHLYVKEISRYLTYYDKYNVEDHPWSERVNFQGFNLNDLQLIKQYLAEIPEYAKKLIDRVSAIVEEKTDYHSCRSLSENGDKLLAMIKYLPSEEIFEIFKIMTPFPNDLTEPLWLNNTQKLINHCFDEFGVESTIASDDIGDIQSLLRARSSAKNSFIKSIKWSFSKEKTRLARVLVANGLRDDSPGLDQLTKRLDNRLNLQHQLTKLKGATWIKYFPETNDKETINVWFDKVELALNAKLLFSRFANFKEYFNLDQFSVAQFHDRIEQLAESLEELPKRRLEWNKYILPRQIDLLLVSESYYDALKATANSDFDGICEMDRMWDDFSETKTGAIDKLINSKATTIEGKVAVFENSLKLAWIDHIERKNEILRTPSTLKFDQMIEDLQSAVEKKLELSEGILLQRAREKTYGPIEYNRLNNRVTYRDLQHQVTKKRRIWPIRRLMTHFAEELFNLVPCWMASPESVSAMFPMENLFDLVIFDEASQCFSEKGLPAMYRGKQVVVTGDQMQLQPNDLYKVRWDDEEEGIEYEIDSLLGLCSKYLMQSELKGHYRSQSLDLIDFSNRHFYKGKLNLLPQFDIVNENKPGIEYHKVDGVWEQNSNVIEAERIVSIVQELKESDPQKTIGIVTFNAIQQGLILDKLEVAGCVSDESLFVKNIENVQGDERDIVIFSVGYGPNKNGKISVQFGSLNAVGGENRLNVAITRAREKIIVITSVLPEQLDTSKTKNDGPKLLEEYLKYAKHVSDGKFKTSFEPEIDKGTDWFLKNKLKKLENDFGFKFEKELSFADLTVKSKNHYGSLLLTDDDLYYSSPSQKEHFVYRLNTMNSKGWKYRLFHSRNIWLEKQKVKENLGRFLEPD